MESRNTDVAQSICQIQAHIRSVRDPQQGTLEQEK